MNNLTDYNTCPCCGNGEMQCISGLDVCRECGHMIRVPSTTELWLNNLEVGDEVYVAGEKFTKIQSAQGKYYWQHSDGPWFTARSMLDIFGTKVEVRCAS